MLPFIPFFEAGSMPSAAQHRTASAQSQQSCTHQQASKKHNRCPDTHTHITKSIRSLTSDGPMSQWKKGMVRVALNT